MFWKKRIDHLPIDFKRSKSAVVRVGSFGRGFMCSNEIVTAASCLPYAPKFNPFGNSGYEKFPKILGQLGQEQTADAYCTFFDSVNNIAILQEVRPNSYSQEEYRPPVAIREDRIRVRKPRGLGEGVARGHTVWVLDAQNVWQTFGATVLHDIRLHNADEDGDTRAIALDGLSCGSPILDEEGFALGMICVPQKIDDDAIVGAHPILAWHLPGVSLRELESSDM